MVGTTDDLDGVGGGGDGDGDGDGDSDGGDGGGGGGRHGGDAAGGGGGSGGSGVGGPADAAYNPLGGGDDDELGGGGRGGGMPLSCGRKRRRRAATAAATAAAAASAGGIGSRARMGGWNRPLSVALDAEDLDAYPPWYPAWYTLSTPPSVHPPRRLCAVCVAAAAYTCTRCGLRWCRLACGRVHDDTQCLKFTM